MPKWCFVQEEVSNVVFLFPNSVFIEKMTSGKGVFD